jgi:Helix-turn-helix domain
VTAAEDRFAIIPEAVLYDVKISANAVRVYGVLDRHADGDGGCWPSQARLGELAHLSRRATQQALYELVEAGRVERQRRGRTLTNTYRVMRTQRASLPSDAHPAGKRCAPSGQSDAHPTGAEREPKEREPLNDDARHLCEALADSIAERGSKRPTITAAWIRDMDRLLRLDGRAEDDVARVIRWLAAGADEIAAFWAPNVRSPGKLRARWDTMREQVERDRAKRGRSGARTQRNRDAAESVVAAFSDSQPQLPRRSAS